MLGEKNVGRKASGNEINFLWGNKGRELEVDKVADGVGVRIRTFQKRGSSRNSIP